MQKLLRNIACLMIPASFALAQDQPETIDPRKPADPTAAEMKDSNQGVYVRDSAAAVEKLALAERMERLKEWNKSADIYQEVLTTLSDRVMPSLTDKDNRIYQYASVANVVHEKLCRWPSEGLDVYRARYETDAAAQLVQARDGDREALTKIVTMYFATDSAKAAAVRLIDDYFENGDFPAAAWLASRLLAIHPNIEADRPMLLYRSALAYHLCGYKSEAQQKAAELKSKFPEAIGKIRGGDIALNGLLEKELSQPIVQRMTDPDRWTMPFGSYDRARVPSVESIGGAKIFSVELSKSKVKTPQAPNINFNGIRQRQSPQDVEENDRQQGYTTGILPVFDRGEMFFNDNATVYAVTLDSGLPLAGWMEAYPSEATPGRYTTTFARTPRGCLFQTAITETSIYAVLGQSNVILPGMNPNVQDQQASLVCLDRTNGREKWKITSAQLGNEELKQLSFSSSILVVGDSVFLTAHNRRQMQFEDCYLLCIDANNGKLKWSNIIASSTPPAAYPDFDGTISAPRVSQLAYSGGRVYVLSNTGAISAVDAYSGQVAWLNIYPREQNNDPTFRRQRFGFGINPGEARKPWTVNPIIVSDNRVFVLPSDGKFIHIYDAGGGKELKRIALNIFDNDNKMSTLIGVQGDRLLSDDGNVVYCINWNTFDEKIDKYENLFWEYDLKNTKSGGEVIRGRSLLTEKYVLVPSAIEVSAINLDNGVRKMVYPPRGRVWDESEGPGNVLVTSSHLIVATPSRVNVYTDLSVARKKLDAEIAAAPTDPSLRLKYAEVMFVAGDATQALKHLDDAISVAPNAQPAVRDRVFTTSMSFAGKLLKQNKEADLVNKLFDRAAAMAVSPQQQVSYRLNRARFARDRQDPTTQVKLLSEILAESRYRSVPVGDGSGSPTVAAVIAEKNIAEAIKKSPTLYAPFEELANASFNAAQASADPVALLEVSQRYPNSKLAPQAMLAGAQAYETTKNPRMAVQVLRQLYFKYPDQPQKLAVIESMVRNYLQIPNGVGAASARLAQAANMDAKAKLSAPLMLPDGKELKDITYAEAQQAIRQFRRVADAKLLPVLDVTILKKNPDGTEAPLFLPETKANIATNVRELLVPDRDFSRPDRVVASLGANGLGIFAPHEAKPLFVTPSLRETIGEIAWIGENLLVRTDRRMVLINGQTGETAWDISLNNIASLEVASGADSDEVVKDEDATAVAQDQNGQMEEEAMQIQGEIARVNGRIIRRNGGVVIINNGVRQIVQPGALPIGSAGGGELIGQMKILNNRVIISTSTGRVIAMDLASGKTLWQARAGDMPVERLLANEDFIVITQLKPDQQSTRVLVLDSLSGNVLSRKSVGDPQRGPLINAAISNDGKLVYLLRDELSVKDLYSPGDDVVFTRKGQRGEATGGFAGAAQPQQLVIDEDKIFVVANNGQFVRIYSLDNGDLLMPGGKRRSDEGELGVPTRDSEWRSWLMVMGQHLYCIGAKNILAYNMDREGSEWEDNSAAAQSGWIFKQVIPAQDVLVAVQEEMNNRPAAQAQPANRPRLRVNKGMRVRLKIYSREIMPSGLESGLESPVMLNEPAGIDTVQVINGGIAYHSMDGKLHFLKSSGK